MTGRVATGDGRASQRRRRNDGTSKRETSNRAPSRAIPTVLDYIHTRSMCAFYFYAEWKIFARPQMETSRVDGTSLGSLSESDSLEHVVHLEQRAHVLLRKLSSRRGQTAGNHLLECACHIHFRLLIK